MKPKCNLIELVTLTLVVLALLLSANASAQNLLLNPSFETGDLTGWDLVGPGGSQSVGAPGIGAQDGSFAVKLTAPSDGVPEVSQGGFSQPSKGRFPASEGDEFNLSGYMLTETALPTGATFGLLKIVFEDAIGNDLAPASISVGQGNPGFPGVESLPFLDSTSPANTWLFAEAQGVAPAGTASVFFLVLNVDFGNGANHPMWFDNISATEVLSGLLGDYNGNDVVDAADYTVWRDNLGSGTALPNDGGLGTPIGQAHYDQWKTNFGDIAGAGAGSIGAAAVPEPATLFLAIGSMVSSIVLLHRRKQFA